MNFKGLVIVMAIAASLFWLAWSVVVIRIDPSEAGLSGLLIFYVTLLAALVATLSVAGVFYRVRILKRNQLLTREVKIAIRHAIILSLVAVVSLALSAKNLLFWWNLLGLFILMGVVEYGFILVEESRRF